MNTHEAIALLWLVKAHWPHFEIFGPEQLPMQAGAWVDILGDISPSDARAALAQMATAGREFPPTAGQLRAEVMRLRDSGAPDTDEALAEVLTAVRERGWTANMTGGPGLNWSHPAVGHAVDAVGGWQEVCASDNPEAFRAHFHRAYESAAERSARTENAPPIVAALTDGAPVRPALAAVPDPKTEDDRPLAAGNEPGIEPEAGPVSIAASLAAARSALRPSNQNQETA